MEKDESKTEKRVDDILDLFENDAEAAKDSLEGIFENYLYNAEGVGGDVLCLNYQVINKFVDLLKNRSEERVKK